MNTAGKTACHQWQTDRWQDYGRELPNEVIHEVSKALTQQLERANGIVPQQTGRWHRKQNQFGKVWPQSALTLLQPSTDSLSSWMDKGFVTSPEELAWKMA